MTRYPSQFRLFPWLAALLTVWLLASAQTASANICSRTTGVQSAIIAAVSGKTTCQEITNADLAGITTLAIAGGLTSLQAGDFAGLTGLTSLTVAQTADLSSLPAGVFDEPTSLTTLKLHLNASLSSLPAGVFDKLTSLTTLSLQHNALSSLPADVFDKLTSLTTLDLRGNGLSSLPAGVFDELTALTRLELHLNSSLTCLPFIPSSVTTLNLDKARSTYSACGAGVTIGKSSVNVAKGATATYTVVLDAVPNGSAGDVTVTPASSATGKATVSGALTFTQDNWSTTQTVTVTGVAAGSATISHTTAGGGYGSVSAGSVSVTVPATDVCTRTTEVRDAIVAAVSGISACANVTTTHLAGITTLSISNKSTLTTLKADDFADLTGLTSLTLNNTGVSSLPADVFNDLTSLASLTLTGNSLSSLSASVFDKLTGLTTLSLTNSSLTSLPVGIFDELTSLTTLSLNQNSDLNCLPLIPSSVTTLNLDKARNTYSACGAGVTLGKSSVSVAKGATATYTVVLDAYPTGDVTVTPASSATGTATVSGALTFTQSNWSTAQTVTVTAGAAGSATISHTIAGGGYGSVSVGSVSVTVPATGVCTRTTEVRDAIVAAVSGISACANVTTTHLAGITTLSISNKASLTTLKAGDFADLTGLTSLTLTGTGVSSLPAGIFDEPTSLTTLTLTGNALSSLSASVFDKLTGLTTLSLTNNSLSSLPAGIFDELTSLTTLALNQNTSLTCLPFIPSSVTTLNLDRAKSTYSACGAGVTLGKSSVTVAKGATATYTVVLDAYPTGDVTVTPASSATATATVSSALTFTQSNWSTTQSVTVTGGSAAGSATISHTIAGGGYGSVSAGSVSVTVPATNVCTRTTEVRDAIVGAVTGKGTCAEITTADLAGITNLGVGNEASLTTLKSGDFNDLTGLTTLRLINTGVSSLPAGVFDDLTSLTALYLHGNSLSSLPAGIFDKLTGLTTLNLASNSLSSLSVSVFDKLTSLTTLSLTNNSLSSLPAGVFDKLTGLTTLSLNQNTSLTCLPFIPSSVTTLSLDEKRNTYSACGAAVTLGKSSVNVAKGATATYTVGLDAYPTGTVTVTPASSATGKAMVSGALTFTQDNWSTAQSVTVTGVTAGLATISHTVAGGGYGNVSVGSVSVTVPVTDVCARTAEVRDAIVAAVSGKTACGEITTTDLAGITTLSVTNKATLTTLKAGDFNVLSNLTTLTLSNNALSTLPAVVFNELTKLTTLSLNQNTSLTCLPFIPSSVTTLNLDKARSTYNACGAAVTLGKSGVTVAKGATATYTVVLDASPNGSAGNVTVTPASSATATATVSGALTFTQSNWSTTQTVTVTGVAAGSATISHTIAGGGYGSVSVGSVSVTVPATGVCARTAEVRDAIVAAVSGKSACADITTTDLAGITTLSVTNKATLTTLKSGDFADLAGLTTLTLTNTGVSSLPAGIFDDLTKLTTLTLTGNSLSSLSASVFDKLTGLTTLRLTNNGLSSLPVGIFDELTGLTTLSLNQNTSLTCLPFIPSSVTTLNLDKAKSAYAACGAGVTLDKSSVNVAKGAIAMYTVVLDAYPTGNVTVTPASSVTAAATVSSGALTFTQSNWSMTQTVAVAGRAAGSATISHTIAGGGYGNVSVGSVSVTVPATDVCTRTAEVRDAIVAAVTGKSACGDITTTDLAGITTLSVTNKPSLTRLKSDDFADLGNLTSLTLTNTGLLSLSAGIFDELTGLTTLSLSQNIGLSSLPAGIFDELTKLTTLSLNQNTSLTCLPFIPPSVTTLNLDKARSTYSACGAAVTLSKSSVDVARGGTATYRVVLDAYPTGDVTVTPASSDTGKATVSGALTFTQSNWNTTQTVTVTGVDFGSATISHTVAGGGYGSVSAGSVSVTVPATAVCTRTRAVRDAIVAAISGKTACGAITTTDLAGITTLSVINKSSLTTLKSDDFDDVVNLKTLTLINTSLSSLPAGVFDKLAKLTTLTLNGNNLSSLPAGVFDKLTSLTILELDDNRLSSLSTGVFDKLTKLTTLDLNGNSLSNLPAGVFDKLTSLTTLDLDDNKLSSLPAGVFDKLTSLTTLDLNGNSLSSLPAGVFDKLTSLSSLDLKGNGGLACLPAIPASVTTLKLDKAKSAYTACGAAVTLSKSSVDVAKGATETYTVVLDAYPTGTVTVTPSSSATGKATVSDALTFTQDNWNTTQSVTLTGVTAGAATISHTIAGGGYGNVSVGSVSVTVPVTGVCARTEEVRDAIVAAVSGKTACADITTTDLAGMTTLSVTNESTLTTLKAGDFTGLTSLTTLTLSNNALSTLPAVVFNELTKLTTLTLSNNSLSSLPVGVFDDLTVLTTLNLKGNGSLVCLPAIPASVTTLELDKAKNAYDVCGAALTLDAASVTVTKDATATYTVVLAEAPTGDVTVTPASSATATVTVSGALTFTTSNWSTPQTVTVTGVTAGTATISHTTSGGGYDNASAASVTATVSETHVCIRTPQVRDAIVAAVSGKTACADITTTDLLGITTLSVVFDPTLTSLKPGDFAGLTNLTTLNLLLNALSSLPARVFDPLTKLTTLALTGNRLSTLPVGVFDPLTKLTTLFLDNNGLSSLPAGVFDNLTELTTLFLNNNSLSSLPAGVFDNLTKLTTLSLDNNGLSSLPAGVFDNLTKLTTLSLNDNSLSRLPARVFGNLTKLTTLLLNYNRLSSVPSGVFDNLTRLTVLNLGNNRLVSLPAGVFDNLPAGITLELIGNESMTCLPAIPPRAKWSCPHCLAPNSELPDYAVCGAAAIGTRSEDETEEEDTETETDGCDCAPSLGLTLRSVTLVEGSTAQYAVSLTQAPSDGVTVTVSGSDDSAVTVSPAALTFTPSDWNTAQTVTLTAVQDPDTLDEAVTVTHVASGGGYDGVGADFTVMATVTDDDVPALIVTPASAALVEGGEAAAYTVALTTLPSDDVTVMVSDPDEDAVTVSPVALTFTPSDWNTAQTVTLTAVQDPDTLDEAVTVTHVASGGGYDGVGADFTVMATVTDDDVPALILSPTSTTLVEGGEVATYTVALATLPTAAVTVTVSSPDEDAVTVSPVALTFTPSDWSTAQTVTLNAVQDPDAVDEAVTLAHAASGGGYDGVGDDFAAVVTDDDAPALILSPTSAALDEGGEAATYTVALATLPTAAVMVVVSSSDKEAVTVSPVLLRFTPSDWNTEQTVTLTAVQDFDTLDETVSLAHTASGGGYDGVGADFTATVTDDDGPALILSPTIATLMEGGEAATYTVTLATLPSDDVTVMVSNLDEEAVTVRPVSLRFAPSDWNTAQTVTLSGVDDADTVAETVTLTHVASGGGYDGVAADFTATVTDDDAPALILSPTIATLMEGGEAATYTVALTTLPSDDVTVMVSNLDEEAVTVRPVELTFTPDDWNAPQTVTLNAVQDPDAVDEAVTLTHVASGGGYDGVAADSTAMVTDDDVPALILSPTSAALDEGGEAAAYTVALATLPTAAVIVVVSNPDEEAVTVSPVSLTFTPSDWRTAQPVTLTAIQDADTVAETVTLTHTALGGGYDGVGADFTATVTDDGVPALVLSPTSTTLIEGGEAAAYTVALSTLPSDDVTVTVSSPDEEAVTVSPVLLRFTPSDWRTAQPVTLTAVQDADTVAETVTLTHVALGGDYDGVGADFTATVTDDDAPALILSPTRAALIEGGEAATYTVALTTLPSDDVTVMVSNPDDGALTVSPVSLTFTPSDWRTAQTVTLTAVQDPDAVDEAVTLTHAASGGGYDGVGADFAAAVTDDDVPALILSPTRAALIEGGEAATYTVALATLPTAAVMVVVSSPDEEAVTVSPVALTFTPSDWNTAQTVTLTAVQDADTVAETVTLTHTALGGGYDGVGADFAATVTDDDVPALILSPTSVSLVEGGESAAYTVALATLPSDDVTVMVSSPDEEAVTVSPVSLRFTPSDWNTAQSVTLSAVQDFDTLDETVSLAHTASGGGYDGVGADFMATVADDDVPALILSPTSVSLVEGGESAAYTVALATLPSDDVTVTVSSPDEEAVTVSPVLLRFTPSDWNTAQSVTLSAVQDFDTLDETVSLTHTASGGGYDGVGADFTATVTDDDVPALIVTPTNASLDEGGEAATYTVALATLPTSAVMVVVSSPDEEAVTVSPVLLRFTPSDWNTAQTVTLTAVQDPDVVDETVTLTHVALGGGYDGVGADFTAMVTDDDVPALVVTPASVTLVEGGESTTYTVALATLPTAAVTVMVSSPDEDAVMVSPVELTFAPSDWSTPQTVTLSAVQDPDAVDEAVTLTHTALGGGYDGVGADFAATVTDDDVPALILSPTSVSLVEGGESAAYTVALATLPTAAVMVVVSSPDEEAVTVSPVLLRFTPSDWNTAQTVTLTAVQDFDTLDETVTLAHTALGGGYDGVEADFAAAVSDDDVPALVLSSTNAALDEGGESAAYTVALATLPSDDVTVTVSSPDEDAVTVGPVELTFAPSDWSTPQTVTLTAVQDPDTLDETVTLMHPASGGGYDGVGADFTATVTDDDVPALIVTPASATLVEGGESATYTVALATLPTADVTVTLGSPDEDAVTVNPVELTFTPSDWNTPQPVTLDAVLDTDLRDEVVTIAHVAGGGNYDGLAADFTATVSEGVRVSPGDESFKVGETTVTIITRGDPPQVLVLLPDPLTDHGTTLPSLTVTLQPGDATRVTGNGFRLVPADTPVVVDVDVAPVPDGGVTVCLPVPPAVLSAAPPPSQLRLLYAEGGAWTALESTYDLESGMLCARNVTLDGLFGVGRVDVRPPLPPGHRLQREILARVGQTVLEGALDAITERVDGLMSGVCEPVNTYELGGYTIGGASLDLSALPRSGAPALQDVQALYDAPALPDGTLSTPQLLGASSFLVSSAIAEDDVEDCVHVPRITLWGKGRYWQLSGSGDGPLSWNGDLLGVRLGVDLWAREQWLTGLTLGWADGTFDWTAGADSDAYGIALTSLHPYVGWRSRNGNLGLWGTLGYGWGQLDLASLSESRDLQMTSAAVGLVRRLATSTTLLPGGTTTLSGKGELAWGHLSVDEQGLVDAAPIATQRLRGLLEVAYERLLDDGGRVSPSVAVGLRYDGGDAARGLGLETSVELTYEAPRYGLTVSGQGRLLVASDAGYEEWGGDVTLRIDPGASRRGLSVSVAPAYGASASNVEGLWSQGVSLLSGSPAGDSARLQTEVAYGLAALGGRGLVTPYSGLSVEAGSRQYVRLGGRFELDLLRRRTLALGVEGRYGEQASGTAEGAVLLEGHVNW